MIGRLEGPVVAEYEDRIVIDAGGIGYEVIMPPHQLKVLRNNHLPPDDPKARLSTSRCRVELFVHHHVPERKPVPALFGFNDPNERRFFELLAGVSRFGPTAAAKSMTISVPEYASLIMTRDIRGLSRLPGIGTGKAEQIIAQLRGKVALFAMMPKEEVPDRPPTGEDQIALETQVALEDLGYRTPEAEAMVRAARQSNPKAESVEKLLEAVYAIQRQPR